MDLVVCPFVKFQRFDDSEPEQALIQALQNGQRHGYVNHWEQHVFLILDVDADAGTFFAIVFSVLHNERRAYVLPAA